MLHRLAFSPSAPTSQIFHISRSGERLAVECIGQQKRVDKLDSRCIIVSTTVTLLRLEKSCDFGAWSWSRRNSTDARPTYIHNADARITYSCGISTRLSNGWMMLITDRASKQKLRLTDIAGSTRRPSKVLKQKDDKIRCSLRKKDSAHLTSKTLSREKKESNTAAPGQGFHFGKLFSHKPIFRGLLESFLVEINLKLHKLDLKNFLHRAKGKQGIISILLNLLAVLYGSGIAATEIADDASPTMPASFISLLRSTLALLVHFPALANALRDVDPTLIRAGVELASWSFLSSIIPAFSHNGICLNDAPLLYALSVVLVVIMKACAGQSVTRVKWFSISVALCGMGVLEEEGSGWKGINVIPQSGGNLWVLASSFISALQIYRAEALGVTEALDAKSLNALQTAVLFLMSFLWEVYNVCSSSCTLDGLNFATLAQHFPWFPLIYSGLVSGGLCSWLETNALRGVLASNTTLIYTTIPLWAAFFSTLVRHKSMFDLIILGGSVILLATTWTNKMASYLSKAKSNSQLHQSTVLVPQQHHIITNCKSSPFDLPQQEHVQLAKDGSYTMGTALMSTILSADHLPGVMLITQLKSPFYAAQTERLVNDLDHLLRHVSTNSLANSLCYFKGDPLQTIEIIHHATNTVGICQPPPFIGSGLDQFIHMVLHQSLNTNF